MTTTGQIAGICVGCCIGVVVLDFIIKYLKCKNEEDKEYSTRPLVVCVIQICACKNEVSATGDDAKSGSSKAEEGQSGSSKVEDAKNGSSKAEEGQSGSSKVEDATNGSSNAKEGQNWQSLLLPIGQAPHLPIQSAPLPPTQQGSPPPYKEKDPNK